MRERERGRATPSSMSALPSLLNLLLVRAGPGIYPSFDYLTASFSFRKGTAERRGGERTIIANSLEISPRNFHRRSTAGRNWLLETSRIRVDDATSYRRVSDSIQGRRPCPVEKILAIFSSIFLSIVENGLQFDSFPRKGEDREIEAG